MRLGNGRSIYESLSKVEEVRSSRFLAPLKLAGEFSHRSTCSTITAPSSPRRHLILRVTQLARQGIVNSVFDGKIFFAGHGCAHQRGGPALVRGFRPVGMP